MIELFEDEDHNSIENDYILIFVFNNIYLENIVSLFKVNDIQLFGGTRTRRNMLSTVQVNLTKFLMLINDMDIDLSVIYKNYNFLEIIYFVVEIINSRNYRKKLFLNGK